MAITAGKKRHGHQYRFTLLIDGFTDFAAMEVGPLGSTRDVVMIREGGSKEPIKEEGLIDYKDITVKAAVSQSSDAYLWWLQAKLLGDSRNITIRQNDGAGIPIHEWTVKNAIIKEFDAANWNNSTSEATAETLVLAHEGFTRLY